MVEPDIKIGESDGSAVISIPPGWKTDIVYQGISETHPSEGDPDDEEFNYHLNDKVGELGTSTIFPQKEKFDLSLGFRHERSQDPSTKLDVLKEIGSDSLTFTILSRDKPGSTRALDISTSDMYAKVHLLNTTPPPKTGPGHAEPAGESELTAPKKGAQTLDDFSKDSGIDPDKLIPGPLYHPPPELKDLPIAIIGAGAAGLYTAMILDSLGIKYEILEGSGRHGGRILTHTFTNELRDTPYQYFECGAMRFPDIFLMRRTFNLARKRLGMGEDKFVKMIMHIENAIKHFNGISAQQGLYSKTDDNGKTSADTFKIGKSLKNKDGYIPQDFLDEGTSKLYNKDTLGPLRDCFVDMPFTDAFLKLMRHDNHSVRSYMRDAMGYPDSVIRWIEDMEWRTGGFDMSLTESVIASLSFDDPRSSEPDWYCFNGGTQTLIDGMLDKVKIKPKLYKRVTSIKELAVHDNQAIEIPVDTQEDPRRYHPEPISGRYSNVIPTLPLSVLRTVDLDGIYLPVGQKNALRELQYHPSVKIGIQFKSAWWEKMGIVGRQTYTDRPSRTIVYPSYGPIPGRDTKNSNVLIAAYNGLLDSQRLAVYMKGYNTPQEKILLEIVMNDLAAVHQKPVNELWNEYLLTQVTEGHREHESRRVVSR
ncbi:L-amino acid oxidase [Lentinula aciculospora]|uniref:L-amino acid oxidase n=1 Tax=Lentinula aciculospora TaxID=153920 RepID=A0A9W9DE93_9AGAR|nr:L-amino acid oxidase [Lentinula aciculospora]